MPGPWGAAERIRIVVGLANGVNHAGGAAMDEREVQLRQNPPRMMLVLQRAPHAERSQGSSYLGGLLSEPLAVREIGSCPPVDLRRAAPPPQDERYDDQEGANGSDTEGDNPRHFAEGPPSRRALKPPVGKT